MRAFVFNPPGQNSSVGKLKTLSGALDMLVRTRQALQLILQELVGESAPVWVGNNNRLLGPCHRVTYPADGVGGQGYILYVSLVDAQTLLYTNRLGVLLSGYSTDRFCMEPSCSPAPKGPLQQKLQPRSGP